MMRQESAETLALQALAWLAGQQDLMQAFLSASGAAPDHLAELARDPAFLTSVLDHVLTDDALVIGFCEAQNLPFTAPREARAVLPGGEAQWT